ncbi:Uncharacterised protein [Mycobacteroides abscessus subsp. abscessus]|nr:Uncharacterised protein [Mycobacteroides abscessus subsp. abscessus]
MALIRRRSSGLTSAIGMSKALDATKLCRSSPELKASIRPSSPDRCAMMRISIWL